MQATLRSTACALTLALVSGSAHAGILYVDDGGGPGIDYTDIQSAIDAAGHGDKIIVHPGNYSGFILGKGVTILGFDASNTTVITSPTVISGVPGPKRAILTGMRMDI
ncbi:MAG: pectin methylesterase-like acyl-CoA thioesterase, partial [Candidatus Paceibacteria bacterium]